MTAATIPLFPLHTVLFPGGLLPLRIFEVRYLDMIRTCLKQETGFGVCLIRSGKEVGEIATPYEIGTLAHIVDWNTGADGLLGITARGEQRFRIVSAHTQADRLTFADIEWIANDPPLELPPDDLRLSDLLRALIERLGHPFAQVPGHYADAGWVSARLAELLPLDLHAKQQLLQLQDPLQRLISVRALINELGMEI